MERRDFLKASALGAAAGLILPAGILNAAPSPARKNTPSANDKVTLGFIGLGQ